jgi:transaldolase
VEVLFWKTYLEVVRRGSDMMKPIWEASNHKLGYLSGQVDPRNPLNEELMSKQALELAAQNPNVMIKCPGTAEGIRLIRRLTALGIATNCTLAFILPQFVSVMDAVHSGLAEAKANNVNMYRWRSVITHMSARYEERKAFDESAAQVGVSLTLEDKRWASIAIFRKAYKIAKRRGYPGKMLFCSMRRGPFVDGVEHIWHIEKLAGGSIVFTCPPGFLTEMWELDSNLEFKPTIEDEVSPKILEKLWRVPYFTEAYQEEMDPVKFATLAPTVFTIQDFLKATEKTVTFIRERIAAVRG